MSAIGLLVWAELLSSSPVKGNFCSSFKTWVPEINSTVLWTAHHCVKNLNSDSKLWWYDSSRLNSFALNSLRPDFNFSPLLSAQTKLGQQDVAFWKFEGVLPEENTYSLPVLLAKSWPVPDEEVRVLGFPGESVYRSVSCYYTGVRLVPYGKGYVVKGQIECPAALYKGLSGGMVLNKSGQAWGVLVGGNMNGFRPSQELLVEPIWNAFGGPVETQTVSSVYKNQVVKMKMHGAEIDFYQVFNQEGVKWAEWFISP